jgi:hypothetical protein
MKLPGGGKSKDTAECSADFALVTVKRLTAAILDLLRLVEDFKACPML